MNVYKLLSYSLTVLVCWEVTSLVKRIVLVLDDAVFERLQRRKRKRTWEEMLVAPLIREREPKIDSKIATKRESKKATKQESKQESS